MYSFCKCKMERIGYSLGLSLGHLSEYGWCSNPLVFHCEFSGCGIFPIWYHHNDYHQNAKKVHPNTYSVRMSTFIIEQFWYLRDIAKYNTDDDLEESIEETGWKLVHGDVFRPPVTRYEISLIYASSNCAFFDFLYFQPSFCFNHRVGCSNLLHAWNYGKAILLGKLFTS